MSSRRSAPSAPFTQLASLLTLVLVVAVLYLAKAVIVPLVLAPLLAFVLWPLVAAVQRRRLARVPAVLIVVGLTILVVGVVAWGVGTQLTTLIKDFPNHSEEVHRKIAHLKSSGTGPISRFMETFSSAEDASTKKSTTDLPVDEAAPSPQNVVVTVPSATPLERIESLTTVILEPIADSALVLILVIYTLIKREDLRNRVIGLLGHGHMTGTTRVFVDSADKISKLLLMQLCVNAAFGLTFGIALLAIGVPYWFLFGFLTAVLRFVPFIGTWLAASLPLLLSFAITPGFTQPLIVLTTFIVLDTVCANVIEPNLFGHSTGVSPVALLIAAVFWTWIWGPVGLVLSTPLTVCLVVLGQHVPRFAYLTMLLGDEPALPASLAYYQRLLAGDAGEARQIALQYETKMGMDHLPDEVLVPALRLARKDRRSDAITSDDESFIYTSLQELTANLRERCKPESRQADSRALPLVLGCTAHHRAEELLLDMLGLCQTPFFDLKPMSSQMLPSEIEEQIRTLNPDLVFVAVVPPGGISQARYLCRRLRKQFKDLKIIVGFFGRTRDFDALLIKLRAAGATYVTTSILQSWNHVKPLLSDVQTQAPKPSLLEPASITPVAQLAASS